ncbi:MAG: signal peptidase II [Defluviitaleaceae bacterium]|nr:signal peptidase II [Defluviitaleaceae bacterium]
MYLPFITVALIIFLADQGSKALVRASIPLGEQVEVVPGKFAITHARNRGAADGKFANNRKAMSFFSIASLLGDLHTFYDLRKNFRNHQAAWLFFAMQVGGGLSNLLDRTILKHTTDYLQICPSRKKSPIFNIADIFLIIGGIGLLIIYMKQLILSIREH